MEEEMMRSGFMIFDRKFRLKKKIEILYKSPVRRVGVHRHAACH